MTDATRVLSNPGRATRHYYGSILRGYALRRESSAIRLDNGSPVM